MSSAQQPHEVSPSEARVTGGGGKADEGNVVKGNVVTGNVVTGNVYDKFRTRNPVARYLQSGFLGACRQLLSAAPSGRVLEVGCGPGDLAEALFATPAAAARFERYAGLDIGLDEARVANRRYPDRAHLTASAYQLPFADDSFDLVLCCEVLEHLTEPPAALAEIDRVCTGQVLASVPWEPAWRMMNLARGAYLRDLGNTPGHLQHFSRSAVRRLVGGRFEIVSERRPFPWTVLLARSRG